MLRKLILQLLLFILYSNISASTTSSEKVRFEHYKTTDGLVSNRIFSLQQDKNGFIWIATDFGLQRFDGKNFKLFDKNSYPNLWRNDIFFSKYDGNNILTIGGYNGFVMDYHIDQDTFVDIMPHELEENNYHIIKGAYTSPKGERYLFANCGFYKQDQNNKKFSSLFDPLPILKTGIIEAVYQDEMNRYWLASVNELAVFSESGDFLQRFDVSKEKCGFRTRFMPIKDGKLAISLQADELWIFDSKATHISAPKHIKLPFKDIYTLLKDKNGRIWFATDGDGLWYTDDELSDNTHYVRLTSIEDNAADMQKIYALTEDKNGGIWFGTQNSGIYHINPYKKPYFTFSEDYGFPKNVCSSFVEDNNGNILVSTDGNGLYRINKDGSFVQLQGIFNNLTHLCKATNGNIYASSWGGGILQIDQTTGKSVRISPNGISNTSNTLFSVDATSDGVVWACPGNDDLYKREPNGVWSRIELGYDSLCQWPNKWIICVKEGKDGTRWIITTNSLWRINGQDKKALIPDLAYARSHNPLSLNDGVCDRDGNFYLASNFGVLRFPADGGRADTLDYVPQNNFHTIIIDKKGIIWAAGDMGIVSIDPVNKTYKPLPADYTDSAKNYFYIRSGFVSSNGNIYFGTNGGFYHFNPERPVETDSLGYFGFSDLFINKQKISPNHLELEDGALNTLKELELAYSRTDISIGIDFANFSFSNNAMLRYRLKGLNEEWSDVPENNVISFNYLPTGSYELEVKAEIIGSAQTNKTITLTITVLPPWWATWWFRVLLLLLAIGITTFAYRRRVQNLKEQRQELKAKVDEQTLTLRKLVLEKDRIISVIAHDLKSPMFGIVGALENWLNNYSEKGDNGQQIIEKTYGSASMLQNVLQGLVDWARAKESELDYQPTDVDLRLLIENMCKLQQSRATNKDLNLSFDLKYEHCSKSDERMTSTIVRNLISNAIKFSNRGGNITLKGWETDCECVFQIIDEGIGMTKEQVAQFNARHQLDSTKGTENETGTGLGLILCNDYAIRNKGHMELESTMGVGTTITITLPKSKMSIKKEESTVTQSINFNFSNEILQGNTILVVDDDDLICQNIASTLQPYMQVITASNGKEALEMLENSTVDIIVSDVEMPVMDGIELCKEVSLRKLGMPFLFVSARTEENDRLAGLLSGAIDYIPKPFKSEELLLKLSNILFIRQQTQSELLALKMKESASSEEQEVAPSNEVINPFLERFINVLEANYSNNALSVDVLAKEMAISQSTLGRKLKSIVGKTAVDLLTEFRLNKAKLMLKEKTEETQIGDIAYKVGFSDPSYFSKKYKEFFGHSPSETNE